MSSLSALVRVKKCLSAASACSRRRHVTIGLYSKSPRNFSSEKLTPVPLSGEPSQLCFRHLSVRPLIALETTVNTTSPMAPVPPLQGKEAAIHDLIKSHRVVVFSKTTCPFCVSIKKLLADVGIEAKYVELDLLKEEEATALQTALALMTKQDTVPNVFVSGRHLGGSDDTSKAAQSGRLVGMLTLEPHDYDFDLIIVGGGSGGLAASKEAAKHGRKVAVCNFVEPTPIGTTWGLGGTCVNVGCIPKKLMHQASLLGEHRHDSASFGWPATGDKEKVDWVKMVEAVQNYIGSLNWGYKVELREKSIKYINAFASFVDAHTLKTQNKKGKETIVTSKDFIIATGGRPKYPDIPGKELGITSDDIFSLSYNPGKTLLVGASYISLECAGFLHGVGISSTVMMRSILLRGFDQQMAVKVGDFMEASGINVLRQCLLTKLERLEEGKPGKIKVTAVYKDGTAYEDWFNTVIFAIGRVANTKSLNLDGVGVKLNPSNMKVIHDEREKTSTDNIYAIGDILDGKPELTPMAIQSGVLLARRICKMGDLLTDYNHVPTTVFTPLEYGCIGMAEEDAIAKYGDKNIEVYHKEFMPLEWTLPKHHDGSACYAKLVCLKTEDEKVIGLHYVGPHAGEVTQGFAGMVMMNARKADFDRMIGIHPTTAEVFTTMEITKRSGLNVGAEGC